MKKRFVVVDLETTGNSPKKGDRIIQFAAVVIEDGEIVERFATFINPEKEIPDFIKQFTGITDEVVANAPTFDVIASEILSLFTDSYFVAHNVPFDYSFLQEEFSNCGIHLFNCLTIDTVELSRIMLPWAESYKLGQLAESFSLQHDNPHQADSDAEVTAEIFIEIMYKLASLPLVTLNKLSTLSKFYKSDLTEIINEFIEKKEQDFHSEQDFDIYRGIALKKRASSEIEVYKEISDEEYRNFINSFPFRNGQREIVEFIENAFQTNQHAIIEAGTGIGKSLAYLIPSMNFSKKSGPIVISTHTIQLQQQLIEKEIPNLKKLIPFPSKVTLLKGKSHYLSLLKFEKTLYENDANYDEVLAKSQIIVWLTETETGDIDEINLPSGGKMLWERINCSGHEINSSENPWSSRCFYQKVRKAANESDIIVTNHALLFTDLNEDNQLIPNYDHAIIDEAHHFEEAGRKNFGMRIHYLQLHSKFNLLGVIENDGLLSKSLKVFKSVGLDTHGFEVIDKYLKEIKITASDLFRTIRSFVLEKTKTEHQNHYRIQYMLGTENELGSLWREMREISSKLIIVNKDINNIIQRQKDDFSNYEMMATPIQVDTINHYFSIFDLINQILEKIRIFLFSTQSDEVKWIEVELKGPINSATLYSDPIDISNYLADRFFSNKKSVVLTSATLRSNNSFQYSINKNGLKDFYPPTLHVESPFVYEKQSAILIPSDMPSLHQVSMEEYINSLAFQIGEIAVKTNGRMLVLFTSYEMLKLTYQHLKEMSFLDDFILIAQSISGGSRTKLTKNFISFNKAILLGTNSFWEGIDIQGKDLSVVVITRLPFTSPNDPIFSVKAQKIEEAGGDSFNELSVPEAVIRFKQGVGRLIRTEQDKGVIFVMDRRITTASYGKHFLSSLPTIPVIEGELSSLLKKIDKWM